MRVVLRGVVLAGLAAGLAGVCAAQETPATLVERAQALTREGRFEAALELLEAAREAAVQAGDVAAQGAAASARGEVRVRQGRYELALEAHQQALDLCRPAGEGRCVATALLGLARAQHGRYQLEATRDLAQQALAASEELGADALVAGALAELAWVHAEQGDYAGAEERSLKALEAAERSGDPARQAGVLAGLGRQARLQGETETALAYMQRALALFEQAGDRTGAARTVNNIGIAHSLRGEFDEAMRAFRRGVAVFQELGQRQDVADGLNNIGIVYRRQGQLDLALEHFRQSLAVREELGDKLGQAGSHNNIALVRQNRGDFAGALESSGRALALAEELGNRDEIANVLTNMGVTHRLQGEHEQALGYYTRTLRLREELEDRGGQANVLRSLAILHELEGQPARALELAERSIALARETGLREVLADALATAGGALQALGRLDEARRALEESVRVVEDLRARVAGGGEPQQRLLQIMFSPYARMVDLLASQGDAAGALAWAERGKGRVLLDLLRSSRVEIGRSLSPAERDRERQLRQELTRAEARLDQQRRRARPDLVRLAELEGQAAAARRAVEELQAGLYAQHPELRVARGEAPDFRLPEARGLLPDTRTALLEYAVTGKGVHLFVLTAAPSGQVEARAYAIASDARGLRRLTDTLRGQLAGRDLGVGETARQAHELLLGPARSQLAGRTRLVLVPDGALWELPFQALVTPRGRYLLEEAAVSYAPSLTVLREMAARRAVPSAARGPLLLALGNPAFGAPAGPGPGPGALRDAPLGPLPQSEREVRQLGSLYGAARSRVLTGPEAREDTLKAEAGRYRVVHLATHGFVDGRAPLRSYVALSPGGPEEDGRLEAAELLGLRLDADLVVLSACETGRGQVLAGEGLIGLSWALFVAGSPTAVVSQWKVDSASTTRLMLAFHRRLRQAAPPAKDEALRQAALTLLASREHRHPFYWAGFVLVGDGS